MPNVNGHLLSIHGYTPAEILIGYNPECRVLRGSADQEAVLDFWINTLVPIIRFSRNRYTDNGSHFVGSETVSLLESHGTYGTQAKPQSVSHPSSVGKVERWHCQKPN